MPLMNCPECGKQVSNTAVACPNCGHPLAPAVIESQTVIREVPPPVIEKDKFPMWVLAPILILGALLILLFFTMFRNSEDENQRNVNVSVKADRDTSRPINSSSTDIDRTQSSSIPPSSSGSSTVVIPQGVPPSTQGGTTVVSENPDSTKPDSSTVAIEAKVMNREGDVQPVKAENFYLLDKDVESILSEANIEDETGQGLLNAYGLSILYPERYAKFRNAALGAINKHIKYKTLTDSSGKAELKNVKPDAYYLFGITKSKNGYSIWNQPVSINPGQNALNLTPARMTEVQQQ